MTRVVKDVTGEKDNMETGMMLGYRGIPLFLLGFGKYLICSEIEAGSLGQASGFWVMQKYARFGEELAVCSGVISSKLNS